MSDPSLPRSLGRYEVVGFLAAGGMAEVLLGRFLGPDGFERPVVLKRILPHLARENAFVEMFLDEARIIAQVRHPNVVQVSELVRDGGELFMVMEYLEGESASSLLRRLIAKDERLDPVLAAYIVASACAGLHAAHQLRDDDGHPLGIVHRDVSPQNLFVSFDGIVKVIDFGIAKSAQQVSRTETGHVKGKFGYMSPEHALAKPIDLRADVFSLGIVLYELLTGRRLFHRATPLATLSAITTGPVAPPSRLNPACPVALERICLRSLSRRPEDRYATADAMRQDLLSAMGTLPVDVAPPDQLATLMKRVFLDRKLEKDDMLRRVRSGSLLTELPSSEADPLIDIPIAEAGTGLHHTLSYEAPPARGRYGRLVAGLAVLGLAGAVALGARLRAPAAVATPASSQATPSASLVAEPAAPPVVVVADAGASVRVQVATVPSGADVSIDGTARGITPLELHLDRDEVTHALEVRKVGFAPLRDVVTPNVDQKLRFTLSPEAAPHDPRPRVAPRAPATADPTQVKW